MQITLKALPIAAALLAGAAGAASAQAYWGQAFDPGYTSGWGAPPSLLPHPACSTHMDYGMSPACEVPSGPAAQPSYPGAAYSSYPGYGYGYPGYYGYPAPWRG